MAGVRGVRAEGGKAAGRGRSSSRSFPKLQKLNLPTIEIVCCRLLGEVEHICSEQADIAQVVVSSQ